MIKFCIHIWHTLIDPFHRQPKKKMILFNHGHKLRFNGLVSVVVCDGGRFWYLNPGLCQRPSAKTMLGSIIGDISFQLLLQRH